MYIHALPFLLFPALVPGTSSYPVLTYSTCLRDSFTPSAIALDRSGNIYMTGSAIVDPQTSQSTVLVVKLNPEATQYLYVNDGWSVLSTALVNPFVLGVNLYVPSPLENNFGCLTSSVCAAQFTLFDVSVDSVADFPGIASLGTVGGFVYVKR